MVKKVILIIAAMFALNSATALAQDYRFSVDVNRSDVYIRGDGGIDIEYYITFTCAPGAHPIDVVDVGLPNLFYDLGSVKAWINSVQLKDIRKSGYVPIGVEVHLDQYAIRPGQVGALRVTATNPHMVFPDTGDPNYASVEFYPVYFGSQYTTGATQLKVAFHFPEGADKDRVKWHYREFNESSTDDSGRLTYLWQDDRASPSAQYKFGVSFPKNLVSQVFEPVSELHYQGGGEGVSGALGVLTSICLTFIPFVFFFLIVVLVIRNAYTRRLKYFPPAGSVEAVEIKRGLTAPEAGMLLELPLSKVVLLIIFGLVKKGVLAVGLGQELKLTIKNRGVPNLQPYEKEFLATIQANSEIDQAALKNFFVKWLKTFPTKLSGFNIKKTKEYYQSIVTTAWGLVQSSSSTAELSKNLDQSLGWLMLDKNMDDRLKKELSEHEVYVPEWWPSYMPASSWSSPTTGSGPSVSGVDFADAIVSRIETLSDHAVSHLSLFTSGITSETNPPPVSSGGGGGGGGCACACAGCACACAGGGR